MGAVYEGEDEQLGRRAAVKLLHAEHSEDPEILARFFNEARAVNIIGHPGVVNIYSFGRTDDGCAYIVMELLAGETLRARLARQGNKLGLQGLPILRQVAKVLAVTHEKGIVHRDLKPENIMILSDAEAVSGERIKVLDFGIAKLSQADSKAKEVRTKTGVIMGSIRYISPEQCGAPGAICDRTDVYALGCILYEVLAGQPPFVAEEEMQLIGQHMFRPPQPLTSLCPDVEPALEQLVARMLAKTAEQRPSMLEVAEHIDAVIEHRPVSVGASFAPRVDESFSPAAVSFATTVVTDPHRSTSQRRRVLAAMAVFAVLGLGILLYGNRARDPSRSQPTATAGGPTATAGSGPVMAGTAPSASRPQAPSEPAAPPIRTATNKAGAPASQLDQGDRGKTARPASAENKARRVDPNVTARIKPNAAKSVAPGPDSARSKSEALDDAIPMFRPKFSR